MATWHICPYNNSSLVFTALPFTERGETNNNNKTSIDTTTTSERGAVRVADDTACLFSDYSNSGEERALDLERRAVESRKDNYMDTTYIHTCMSVYDRPSLVCLGSAITTPPLRCSKETRRWLDDFLSQCCDPLLYIPRLPACWPLQGRQGSNARTKQSFGCAPPLPFAPEATTVQVDYDDAGRLSSSLRLSRPFLAVYFRAGDCCACWGLICGQHLKR